MKLSERLIADLNWCAKTGLPNLGREYLLTPREARQILAALKIKPE